MMLVAFGVVNERRLRRHILEEREALASGRKGQGPPSDGCVAGASFHHHDGFELLRIAQYAPVEVEGVAHHLLAVIGEIDDARILNR